MKRKLWLPSIKLIKKLAKEQRGLIGIKRTCGNCHWGINGDYNFITRLFKGGCPYSTREIHSGGFNLIQSTCSGVIREKDA